MLAKYKIEYAVPFRHHEQPQSFVTDDPVTCEQFLAQLLEYGLKINSVFHEGVAVPQAALDKMVKTAAEILMTRHICCSLGIDSAEVHYRFGLSG